MASVMEEDRIEQSFATQNDNPFAGAPAPRAEPAAASQGALAGEPSHAPPRPRPRRLLPLVLFVLTCFTTVAVGGYGYGLAVMTILVCHEAGHFIQARRYQVPASFPFFIPMPNLIGTMGAVIAMDPRIHHRRALFDIGMTGPLFGLLPTLICCYVGLLTEARWIARAAIDSRDP
ncbi:MAG: site-2 protease family protein, partial [Thermoguttaceae bacterium]|nr:site-2 protease family protein [Thermoguttaceae bacterium]